jgi:hypothetical protein
MLLLQKRYARNRHGLGHPVDRRSSLGRSTGKPPRRGLEQISAAKRSQGSAQSTDVHVDRTRPDAVPAIPDLRQQLLPAEHAPAIRDEECHQPKLDRRKVEFRVFYQDPVTGAIERNRADGLDGIDRRGRWPAQHGIDPRY